MSFTNERLAIEKQFLSNWDSTTTPVKLDNVVGLVKGNTKVADQTKISEWCHLSIKPASADIADMNDNHRVRYVGTIFVNVFVKLGSGTDRARILADAVTELLQLTEFDGVSTRTSSLTNGGQTPDDAWYQITVSVPYYRDQIF